MKQKFAGSCHCGKVRFEVELDPAEAVICDCSICTKKGAILGRVSEADVNLLTPLEDMTLYQFNKRIAKHYFCPVCGIHTFNRPRSAPELWAINLRCLPEVDLAALSPKQVHGSRLD
jgi:hypothetical protein